MIPMDELVKLAINSSGALAVAFIAFFFMNKKDERVETHDARYERIADQFNKTVQNHLEKSNEVQKDVALKFQKFSDSLDENSTIMQALYKELVKKTKQIRDFEHRKTTTYAPPKITIESTPMS